MQRSRTHTHTHTRPAASETLENISVRTEIYSYACVCFNSTTGLLQSDQQTLQTIFLLFLFVRNVGNTLFHSVLVKYVMYLLY